MKSELETKALQHILDCEQATHKTSRNFQAQGPTKRIARVIVVGGGSMGSAIAYHLHRQNLEIQIFESDQRSVQRAQENLYKLTDKAMARGYLTKSEAETAIQKISITSFNPYQAHADLVIEAVAEDSNVKKEVFAMLNNSLNENSILATNTSYLDIDDITSAVNNKSRVVGLHFFNPAHIMKLVEVVRTNSTSATTIRTCLDFVSKIGKLPVLARNCEGFIGNRILMRYREAADMLLMDGATPYEIDKAMVAFGYPMGPYTAQDLSGLDIAYANRRRQDANRDPNRRYVPIADYLVEQERLGQKTNAGWYLYDNGKTKKEDAEVVDLILEESKAAGIQRRSFDQVKIQERLLLAMINEAIRLLDDGIACSVGDIDVVSVHGYGFPRSRGGLMYYAEQMGAQKIFTTLKTLEMEDPIVWKPAAGIVRAIKSNNKNRGCFQ